MGLSSQSGGVVDIGLDFAEEALEDGENEEEVGDEGLEDAESEACSLIDVSCLELKDSASDGLGD